MAKADGGRLGTASKLTEISDDLVIRNLANESFSFVLNDHDGNLMVRINNSGVVELGEGQPANEAAAQFWKSLEIYGMDVVSRVRELAKVLREVKDDYDGDQRERIDQVLRNCAPWTIVEVLEDNATPVFKIIVNGREHEYEHEYITSVGVVKMAYPTAINTAIWTITYSRDDDSGGSLLPGNRVKVSNGMVFSVIT